MSWSLDGKDKQQKLFVPTSQVGAEKQVSVKATEDFSFSLSQQIPLPAFDLLVSDIKTQNLTESVKSLTSKGCTLDEISTKFAIRLSPIDGLPEVVSGIRQLRSYRSRNQERRSSGRRERFVWLRIEEE